MNVKAQLTLSVLLLAQVGLALGLFWHDERATTPAGPSAFVTQSLEQVDKILIADGDSESTLLRDEQGNWHLPALAELPANSAQVERLLTRLSELEAGYPMATTASAARRFDVAEDQFQRRLRLYQGDALLGEYYFGSSPGFRQTHARRAGDNAIHAVAINNFDLHAEDGNWLDKSLLSLREPRVIEGPDYRLRKASEGWQLVADAGLRSGEALDQTAVDDLVTALAALRVVGLAEAEPSEPEREPFARLQVSRGEESWTYRFYQDEKNNRWLVARNDLASVFTLSRSLFERLAGKRQKDFLPAADLEASKREVLSDEAATGAGEPAKDLAS